MIIQTPDGSLISPSTMTPLADSRKWMYCAELASDMLDEDGRLIDWLIAYAFDTLDARHLHLRVFDAHTGRVAPKRHSERIAHQ